MTSPVDEGSAGPALHLAFAALSDVGRVRRDNQDSGYAGPHLLVIADGVGGAARGDIASSAAVDAIRKLDVPPGDDALSELAATIHLAHDRLAEIVEAHPELDGTSTTVTAAVFDGSQLQVGHAGDSRGYLLRDGELRRLTTDHSLVQSLVDEGRITEEEARVHPHRNLILKAVDGVHEPEPDLFSVPVQPGDRVLLCSDGCSGVLEPAEMATLLGEGPLDESAGALVRAALEAGSSDNVTVVLAEVREAAEPDAAAAVVVGAAASAPHRNLGDDDATGNLDPGALAGLGTEEPEDLDPEEARYAPRPPRRFGWARRLAVLLVLLLLVGLGAGAAYSWSQGQYYVSDDGGRVVIFKGVKADLPGVTTHHVAERTDVALADLESYDAGRVRSGISAEGLADARRIVADLKVECPEPTTPPVPTATPTKKHKKKGGTAAAAPTTTAAPSPTPAPTPTPTATPSLPAACATPGVTPGATSGAPTTPTTPAPTSAPTSGATP